MSQAKSQGEDSYVPANGKDTGKDGGIFPMAFAEEDNDDKKSDEDNKSKESKSEKGGYDPSPEVNADDATVESLGGNFGPPPDVGGSSTHSTGTSTKPSSTGTQPTGTNATPTGTSTPASNITSFSGTNPPTAQKASNANGPAPQSTTPGTAPKSTATGTQPTDGATGAPGSTPAPAATTAPGTTTAPATSAPGSTPAPATTAPGTTPPAATNPSQPLPEGRVIEAPPITATIGESREATVYPAGDGEIHVKGYTGSLKSGGERETIRVMARLPEGGTKEDGYKNTMTTTYFKLGGLVQEDAKGADGISLLLQGSPHTDGVSGANVHLTIPFHGGTKENVQIEDDNKNFNKLSVPIQTDAGNIVGETLGVKVLSVSNEDGTRTFTSWIDKSGYGGAKPTGNWQPYSQFKTVDTGSAQDTWLRVDGAEKLDVSMLRVAEIPDEGSPGDFFKGNPAPNLGTGTGDSGSAVPADTEGKGGGSTAASGEGSGSAGDSSVEASSSGAGGGGGGGGSGGGGGGSSAASAGGGGGGGGSVAGGGGASVAGGFGAPPAQKPIPQNPVAGEVKGGGAPQITAALLGLPPGTPLPPAAKQYFAQHLGMSPDEMLDVLAEKFGVPVDAAE